MTCSRCALRPAYLHFPRVLGPRARENAALGWGNVPLSCPRSFRTTYLENEHLRAGCGIKSGLAESTSARPGDRRQGGRDRGDPAVFSWSWDNPPVHTHGVVVKVMARSPGESLPSVCFPAPSRRAWSRHMLLRLPKRSPFSKLPLSEKGCNGWWSVLVWPCSNEIDYAGNSIDVLGQRIAFRSRA
jgi:hypothetical protein